MGRIYKSKTQAQQRYNIAYFYIELEFAYKDLTSKFKLIFLIADNVLDFVFWLKKSETH